MVALTVEGKKPQSKPAVNEAPKNEDVEDGFALPEFHSLGLDLEARSKLLRCVHKAQAKTDHKSSMNWALFLLALFLIIKILLDHNYPPDSNTRHFVNHALLTLTALNGVRFLYHIIWFYVTLYQFANGKLDMVRSTQPDLHLKTVAQWWKKHSKLVSFINSLVWGLLIGVVGAYGLQYIVQPYEWGMVVENVVQNATMIGDP